MGQNRSLTVSNATYEDALLLVELQNTLSDIRRSKHQLANQPELQLVADAEAALETVRDESGAVRVAVTKVETEVRKHDKDLKILRHRLAQEQEKLYGGGVTNARELKSVEAEIHAITTRIDTHETGELEGMEKLDELEASIAALTVQEQEASDEVDAMEQRRDEAAQTLLAAIAEGEVSADAQRLVIPRDILSEYERVAKREPRAVGQLKDGLCTACGISLPAIEINDLRAGPTLGTCPCPKEIILLVDKL
ncbi:MAG: putative nucleic acid-binding Zn-ribbon protein [Glaciecola sp.]|jgi:predicted  nucleic acid-binding Zn-ribbon protein